MSANTENKTSKDYLEQLYDSQLESAKEQLTQAYNESASGLDSESEKLKKQRQKDLVQTDVEAQRAKRNYAEIQNAYGLSSGAMAQARLAQDNQHQNDMTDIRSAYAEADADVERRRQLLAQQYTSAIKEAQANNNLERAKALYELAKEEEAKLLAQQKAEEEAKLLAQQKAEEEAKTAPLVDVKKPVAAVGNYISGAVNDVVNDAGNVSKPYTAPDPIPELSPTISAQDYLNAAGVAGAAIGGINKQSVESTPSNTVPDIPQRPGLASKPSAVSKDVGVKAPKVPAATGYIVDSASVSALGRGKLSAADLDRLIAAGEVEEYIEGNTVRFRNKTKPSGGSKNRTRDTGRLDSRLDFSANF